MEDPLGEHHIIELYKCKSNVLDDQHKVEKILLEVAHIAGATIVNSSFHKFSPQGVSGVVVIAESHLSIHTWPEFGYAALDLFTCSRDMKIDSALKVLCRFFGCEHMDTYFIQRGIRATAPPNENGTDMKSQIPFRPEPVRLKGVKHVDFPETVEHLESDSG